jgi:hypothetical protein
MGWLEKITDAALSSRDLREARRTVPYQYALGMLEEGIGPATFRAPSDALRVGNIGELMPNLEFVPGSHEVVLDLDESSQGPGFVTTSKSLGWDLKAQGEAPTLIRLAPGMDRKKSFGAVVDHGQGKRIQARAFEVNARPIRVGDLAWWRRMWDAGPNAVMITLVECYEDVRINAIRDRASTISILGGITKAAMAAMSGLPMRAEADGSRRQKVAFFRAVEWSGDIVQPDPNRPLRRVEVPDGTAPAVNYSFRPGVTEQKLAQLPLSDVLVPITSERLAADMQTAIAIIDRKDGARALFGIALLAAVGAAERISRHAE